MKPVKPWKRTAKPSAELPAVESPSVVSNSAPMIDNLKSVRDEIKKLEAREAELAKCVKELGDGEHVGVKFRAKVKTTTPNRLDTKGLKEVLDEKLIEKFTKTGKPQTTITFEEISA